jgi:hypothetical protein
MLDHINEEIKKPNPEILDNFELIKTEVQSSALAMSMDMRKIERDLADVKQIVDHTYQLVRDSRYRDGIEKIDGAYQIFTKGLHNLEATFNKLENYIYELEVLAEQNLNCQRIREYLRAIRLTEDNDVCHQTFKYILVVRSRYLQISVAYHIYKKDAHHVASEFNCFNREYVELYQIFKEEIGCEFNPEQEPTGELVKKCKDSKKVQPDITQSIELQGSSSEDPLKTFLKDIELPHLYEPLKKEEVSMKLLMVSDNKDLVHFGVEKSGNRLAILKAITTLKTSGK